MAETTVWPAASHPGVASFEKETHSRAAGLSYCNHSGRFVIPKKQFTQQYSHLYFKRLHEMRDSLVATAAEKWPEVPLVNKLLELREQQESVVVGTLYREAALKPNILDDYAKDHSFVPAPQQEKYTSPNDYFVLEDDSGRVKLTGEGVRVSELVSGLVACIKGKTNSSGAFEVEEMSLAGVPAVRRELSAPSASRTYIALISGLDCGSTEVSGLPLQMFSEYVVGSLGSNADQKSASRISRVVIAGNSLCKREEMEEVKRDANAKQQWGTTITTQEQEGLVQPLKELDGLLANLSASVPVDIMAGPQDPTNITMPQQPLHACLLPESNKLSTFHSVTNPYDFSLGDTRILGTAGQNILDMSRYCDMPSAYDCLVQTLKARHLAPTAPDTLPCYPFFDEDPFIITEAPHVYFAGNQPEFRSDIVESENGQRVLVVAVPSFRDTGIAVFVDIESLECHPISFQASI